MVAYFKYLLLLKWLSYENFITFLKWWCTLLLHEIWLSTSKLREHFGTVITATTLSRCVASLKAINFNIKTLSITNKYLPVGRYYIFIYREYYIFSLLFGIWTLRHFSFLPPAAGSLLSSLFFVINTPSFYMIFNLLLWSLICLVSSIILLNSKRG